MASALWQSESVKAWESLQQQYDDIFKQHASDKLRELNRWYETDLPKAIAARSPNRHITQPELVRLVDWKLTHGKWRPRLLDFAKAATEDQVQEASSKAFTLLGSSSSSGGSSGDAAAGSSRSKADHPSSLAAAAAAADDDDDDDDDNEIDDPPPSKKAKTAAARAAAAAAVGNAEPAAAAAAVPDLTTVKSALASLTVLKGVGPATASALLAAVDSSCPFMGDEALEPALGERDYTVKQYLQLVDALRAKADWLNKQCKGTDWNAVLVERCLYAAELQQKQPNKTKSGTKRRK